MPESEVIDTLDPPATPKSTLAENVIPPPIEIDPEIELVAIAPITEAVMLPVIDEAAIEPMFEAAILPVIDEAAIDPMLDAAMLPLIVEAATEPI